MGTAQALDVVLIKDRRHRFDRLKEWPHTAEQLLLEHTAMDTACVYDIKTGRSGLSLPRMKEIAAAVGRKFGVTGRLYVIEVRPQ